MATLEDAAEYEHLIGTVIGDVRVHDIVPAPGGDDFGEFIKVYMTHGREAAAVAFHNVPTSLIVIYDMAYFERHGTLLFEDLTTALKKVNQEE